MADLVQFGPFTVYKSPAYEEAVRQKQADAATERETKKMQQDYLRSQIEKFNEEQKYLKSEEGQAALRAEREKGILGVEKLKGEIAAEEEKRRRSAPEYAPIEAARLSGLRSTLEKDLATQKDLISSAGERVKSLQSASAPLPEDVAGPVMQRDMAAQMMRPALELEADMRNRAIGTEAAQAATSKQLGELVGTVPIPEELGGGTAPVTSVKSIYEERAKELIPIQKKALDYINTLVPGSTEHTAAVKTYDKFTGYTNAETKRMDENSRKIRGFSGMAYTQKGAEAVRADLGDFVPSIQGIDSLIDLGEEYQKKNLFMDPQEKLRIMARADAIVAGLRGSLRKPLVGGGNPSDADQEIIRKALADPTALVNSLWGPGNFAKEKLGELKQSVARRFMSGARANGFDADSIQSILDANRDPKDIKSFRSKKPNEFNSEEEARAAGYGDGDSVIIGGESGTLTPLTQ